MAAVVEMRKSVEKVLGPSSTQMYGDATLLRFLIARSMDTDKAAKLFLQWKKWRDSFVPASNNNNMIPESQIQDELNAKKVFLQEHLSITGNPVVVAKLSNHFPSKDHLQFKRFVVHFLDKTIASGCRGKEIGNEKLIGILDLQNISYKNVDTRGVITGFQFLQSYYPERLAKLYILHMPRFFVSVWRFISRFLEKATLEKIVNVINEEEREEFMRYIGEEALPEEYGGKAKLVLLQDFVLSGLDG